MNKKTERNAFDRYMFEGGMEEAARRGVAEARANLIAKGITPRDSTNTPGVMPPKDEANTDQHGTPTDDQPSQAPLKTK